METTRPSRAPRARRPFLVPSGVFLLLAAQGQMAPLFAQTPRAQPLAATPPMGWNSWDSYGRTLDEKSIRANAREMARRFKRFGWEDGVVDEGWYLADLDRSGNDKSARFEMDGYGRYVPVPARFPSAGETRTFRPLA